MRLFCCACWRKIGFGLVEQKEASTICRRSSSGNNSNNSLTPVTKGDGCCCCCSGKKTIMLVNSMKMCSLGAELYTEQYAFLCEIFRCEFTPRKWWREQWEWCYFSLYRSLCRRQKMSREKRVGSTRKSHFMPWFDYTMNDNHNGWSEKWSFYFASSQLRTIIMHTGVKKCLLYTHIHTLISDH